MKCLLVIVIVESLILFILLYGTEDRKLGTMVDLIKEFLWSVITDIRIQFLPVLITTIVLKFLDYYLKYLKLKELKARQRSKSFLEKYHDAVCMHCDGRNCDILEDEVEF
ncbi:hypothetical protein M8J77_004341 [Diaphorina citri]|nr:hypothetical protein M8J77_004341 [Diaphorina citri]